MPLLYGGSQRGIHDQEGNRPWCPDHRHDGPGSVGPIQSSPEKVRLDRASVITHSKGAIR